MCGSIPASNSNNWSAEESSTSFRPRGGARGTRSRIRVAFARAPRVAAVSPAAARLLESDRVRRRVLSESRWPALVERQAARGALRRPSVFSALQDVRGDYVRRRFSDARRLPGSVYQAPFRRTGQLRNLSAEP